MEQNDFETAIHTLSTTWEELQPEDGSDWQDVRLTKTHNGTHFLRITRSAPQIQNSQESSASMTEDDLQARGMLDDDDDDDDDESLLKFTTPNPPPDSTSPATTTPTTIPIIHDIIYSPTYRVPVLYIHRPPLSPPSPSSPHNFLHPLYAPSAQSTGIMGGLTLISHPETGKPVFCVHPCRTEEAVSGVWDVQSKESGVEWLMVWFGIIGRAVGLSVPLGVARAVAEVGEDRRRQGDG